MVKSCVGYKRRCLLNDAFLSPLLPICFRNFLMIKLTKRIVDAAQAAPKEYFVWCEACPGFGVRVFPSGRKTFVAQVRVGRMTRRVKIGPYGAFTVEQAREKAREVIRDAAAGRDPKQERERRRDALTVAQVCDEYIHAAKAGLVITRFRRIKRPSTVTWDEGRISRHLGPLIGRLIARDLRRIDVQRMADEIALGKTAGTFRGRPRGVAKVRGGNGTAARVVGLLGGIFTWAERRGLVPGPNPCRGIEKAAAQTRDRVLSATELQALGRQIELAMQTVPYAAAAVHFIALTGVRKQEACGLRWSEIDEIGMCLRLAHTKTGRSLRPIGSRAISILKAIPKESDEWVFPSIRGSGSADLKHEIASIFDDAGLKDARSQVLRRTFATIAADLGYWKPGSEIVMFHPSCPFGSDYFAPAIIALMQDVLSGTVTGIHRTALSDDGSRIREMPDGHPAKMMLGRASGAAVLLGSGGTSFAIAEGIETALSASKIFQVPVTAALSASGMANFPLINGVKRLYIFADHDQAGLSAAHRCGERYSAAGVHVSIQYPKQLGHDWNDVLLSKEL